MGQFGLFDADKRLAALSAKGDPLEAIDRLVPWESFRADIEAVVLTPDEMKKSNAGRKPADAVVMFRMLVLQTTRDFARWDAGGKLQTNDLARLPPRNSFRWHRSLPWIAKGATLNRPAEALVAVPEPRAASSRAGGRHHLVMVGDIIPLRRATSSRNRGRLRQEPAIRAIKV